MPQSYQRNHAALRSHSTVKSPYPPLEQAALNILADTTVQDKATGTVAASTATPYGLYHHTQHPKGIGISSTDTGAQVRITWLQLVQIAISLGLDTPPSPQ